MTALTHRSCTSSSPCWGGALSARRAYLRLLTTKQAFLDERLNKLKAVPKPAAGKATPPLLKSALPLPRPVGGAAPRVRPSAKPLVKPPVAPPLKRLQTPELPRLKLAALVKAVDDDDGHSSDGVGSDDDEDDDFNDNFDEGDNDDI